MPSKNQPAPEATGRDVAERIAKAIGTIRPYASSEEWERKVAALIRTALAEHTRELREALTAAAKEMRIQQITIHTGQYHQWATFDICREKACARVRAFVAKCNALAEAALAAGEE
jgi:hypothetical protein